MKNYLYLDGEEIWVADENGALRCRFDSAPSMESTIEDITPSLQAVASREPPVPNARRINIRKLYDLSDPDDFHIAGRARQLLHWRRTHRFCGICGAPMQRDANERAMFCTPCALHFYPRINPVVITLVHRDDSILLARRTDPAYNHFRSVVAGFVEAGESLEEAVEREIEEEVGIKVRNIRYIASQQWPFPNNLMIGFYAEYDSGDIRPDGEEIAEAGWFTRDDLPRIPSKVSIARHLIDSFFGLGSEDGAPPL